MEINVDSRRKLVRIEKEAVDEYTSNKIIEIGNEAINRKGSFTLALSGGSTPKSVIKLLTTKFRDKLDWSKVYLFWSDERAVAPDHQDSNFKMAMDAGFRGLVPENQIYRMKGESEDLSLAAKEYEDIVKKHSPLDLVMLGMGEDGHTASIFPGSAAVSIKDRLIIDNFVKSKNMHRLTFSMTAINGAENIIVLALGTNKKETIKSALQQENSANIVAYEVGSEESVALWITDQDVLN